MASQQWDADRYARTASFVPAYGRDVLALLDPRPGERILDVGCGDGVLTADLAAAGATAVGIDSSPAMVAAARGRGLDARVADAERLDFHAEFDAAFSNAAIHWLARPEAMLAGVARALRPGGRFVGELAGPGNVAAIGVAAHAVRRAAGLPPERPNPWFNPTAARWTTLLRAAGFVPGPVTVIPRPTPLPAGLTGWLEMFGEPLLADLPAEDRPAARAEICALARPWLCDDTGAWTADYVRLRFAARLA